MFYRLSSGFSGKLVFGNLLAYLHRPVVFVRIVLRLYLDGYVGIDSELVDSLSIRSIPSGHRHLELGSPA